MAYIFSDCIKEYEGKRIFKLVSLEEYLQFQSEHLEEVEVEDDQDIGFSVKDFFEHLGSFREDMILVYSHTLDSTQTFMMQHCQGLQNIVCTTDIQTNGKGEFFRLCVMTRSQIKCMAIS